MSGDPKASRLPRTCWGVDVFEPAVTPRLFGMPPGADFPGALAQGITARLRHAPPEAVARVTVYLNTARMLTRVRSAFQSMGPGFLPRLRLVTDLGPETLSDLPPAVPRLRRQLELAQLVQGLIAQQPGFASATAAFDLAESLADLMDEMHAEGVLPAALDRPGLADDHAAHWERSLAFLRIIGRWFGTDAPPEVEARQRLAVQRTISKWAAQPPRDPVIVAGSTGSRGATALFMQAVARLPQGAVILPGFDFEMPESAWNSLDSGGVPDEDHPQFRFARLLSSLDVRPHGVALWAQASPADAARNRVVSLALRPAPITDQWLSEGAKLGSLGPATSGLSLVEAASPREEALATAAALRRAADDGRRAALVSPDRVLVRRVTAALDRWGITPDDSAGSPLHMTPPGRFLRHVAGLFGRPVTIESLLTLLKHPITATGGDHRGQHLLNTRALELHLRRHGPPFPDSESLLRWAGEGNEREGWARWLGDWLSRLPDGTDQPLSAFVETLSGLVEDLAAGNPGSVEASELWRKQAGRAVRDRLDLIRSEAVHGGAFTTGGFADLLGAVLQRETLPEADATHPTIVIQGTREARELQADLVILAGLNEGVWPAPPAPDPWLSRQMRLQVGLLLPERQIGLAAHDFQQAIAAPEVILTRSTRDDEAQTVPSRWLDRLTNLLLGLDGEDGALARMRERGQIWLDLARQMDAAPTIAPAGRPAPRPPVNVRPAELPVTAIRTLIRDPYAIYARYILRLRPLDPLAPRPDARLRGQALHLIVERFIKERPEGESRAEAFERLLGLTTEVLADEIPWPSAQRLWRARIARFADHFVRREAARAAAGKPVIVEGTGSITLPESKFTLTARPDRIDQDEDGHLHVLDYKSGAPPSKKMQEIFDKQLLLEAAMAERGAFREIGPQPVTAVTYIHLGGEGKEKTTRRDDIDLPEVWERFTKLIQSYGERKSGYISRRAVFDAAREGDYDHLARFGEWRQGDPSQPEDVG